MATHQHRQRRHHHQLRDLEVASSSSSSSSSSSDGSDGDQHGDDFVDFKPSAVKQQMDSTDEDESSDDDDDDDDDDDGHEGIDADDDRKMKNLLQKKRTAIDRSSSTAKGLSLSDLIRRRQEVDGWGRGIDSQCSRAERKSRAIESAQQKLAQMRQQIEAKKKRKTDTPVDNDGDHSDEEDFFVQNKKEKRKKRTSVESDDESDVSAAPKNNSNDEDSDDDNDDDDDDDDDDKQKTTRKKKKKNKHKPTEVSSKRADFFRRGAPKLNQSGVGVDIGARRYKPLDPRMSNLSGHFNEEQFQQNYTFLEQMRNQEIGHLRKRIAARKASGEKGKRMRRKLGLTAFQEGGGGSLEEDEERLKTLTQQRAALERSKVDREARQSVKRKIREGVESGQHGAYFLKRREKKRLELEAKLEVIRKRGGDKAVDKLIEKRRKKQKAKDSSLFAK